MTLMTYYIESNKENRGEEQNMEDLVVAERELPSGSHVASLIHSIWELEEKGRH